uniref:Uncharacterized protein n=1 Tax=Oryza meridionalis TaxID=40149 RepID=A0A0E0ECJ9_9ORYZ
MPIKSTAPIDTKLASLLPWSLRLSHFSLDRSLLLPSPPTPAVVTTNAAGCHLIHRRRIGSGSGAAVPQEDGSDAAWPKRVDPPPPGLGSGAGKGTVVVAAVLGGSGASSLPTGAVRRR